MRPRKMCFRAALFDAYARKREPFLLEIVRSSNAPGAGTFARTVELMVMR